MGVASSQNKARELASAEIAKQFKMQISYRNRDTQIETQDVTGDKTNSEFYYSKTQVNTSVEIDHVEFVLSRKMESGVAVLAVVNKEQYFSHQKMKLDAYTNEIISAQETFLKDESFQGVWDYEKNMEALKRKYQKSVTDLSHLGFDSERFIGSESSVDKSELQAHKKDILDKFNLKNRIMIDSNDLRIQPHREAYRDSIGVWCLDKKGNELSQFYLSHQSEVELISVRNYCYGAYQILISYTRSYTSSKMEKWVKSHEVKYLIPKSWKYYSTLSISSSLRPYLPQGVLRESLKAKGYFQRTDAPELAIEGKVISQTISSYEHVKTYYSADITFNFNHSPLKTQLSFKGSPSELLKEEILIDLINQRL